MKQTATKITAWTLLVLILILLASILFGCGKGVVPTSTTEHSRDTIVDSTKTPIDITVPEQSGKIEIRKLLDAMQYGQAGRLYTDNDSIQVKVDTMYVYVKSKPKVIHDTVTVPKIIVVDSTKEATTTIKEVKVSPWWTNTILGAAIALFLTVALLFWLILRKR